MAAIPKGSDRAPRTRVTARYWPDRERYMGTAELGEAAVPKLHFPGLHPNGARWLVRRRDVRAVGLDTASIDYGQSKLFESHRVLGAAGVPVFENVAKVGRLPTDGFVFIAPPDEDRGRQRRSAARDGDRAEVAA